MTEQVPVGRPSRWSRFVEAAVRGPGTGGGEPAGYPAQPTESLAPTGRGQLANPAGDTLRRVVTEKLRGRPQPSFPADGPRRRTDVRLAPAASLVWCAAVAGVWLTPAALLGLCGALLLIATVLLAKAQRIGVPRSFLTTAAIAVLLAVCTAAHSAVASSQRHDGPLSDAVRDGTSVVAILEVTGAPRAVSPAGQGGVAGRWAVPATALDVTARGQVIRGRADIVVMGGGDWGSVAAGQRIRSAGSSGLRIRARRRPGSWPHQQPRCCCQAPSRAGTKARRSCAATMSPRRRSWHRTPPVSFPAWSPGTPARWMKV